MHVFEAKCMPTTFCAYLIFACMLGVSPQDLTLCCGAPRSHRPPSPPEVRLELTSDSGPPP